MRVRLLLTAGIGALLLASPAFAGTAFVPIPPAATTNNVVHNTISYPNKIHPNWDPQDAVTISGDLHDNFNGFERLPCYLGPLKANVDYVEWRIDNQVVSPAYGNGQILCGASPTLRTFYPGTDATGHFSVTSAGGGVSWQSGSGYDPGGVVPPGAIMELRFWEGTTSWPVYMGDTSWGFPCDDAPHVYGVLASTDLNGTGNVDASDLSQFAAYLGLPITRDTGWQANYNHDQAPTVDASDLAYWAGRGAINCNSGKALADAGDYDMDVNNLEVAYIKVALESFGVAVGDVIAAWDAMELSYDHEAAGAILASAPQSPSVETRPWSGVKTLYH
jgi:hypothetical protein